MYVALKDLPEIVKAALKSFGYQRQDISLTVTDELTVGTGGASKGYRALIIVIDLGENRIVSQHKGSWGGTNIFVQTVVDDADQKLKMPDNFVVIKGAEGGMGSYADLYANTRTIAPLLPAKAEELTEREQAALYCHIGIKGGDYRRAELSRWRVPASVVNSLVERGLLKRNKAGATQATTEGKNAWNGKNYFPGLLENGRY